jgi:hypothetical protein
VVPDGDPPREVLVLRVRDIKVESLQHDFCRRTSRAHFRALSEPLVGITAELRDSNTSQPAGYDKPIEAADQRR